MTQSWAKLSRQASESLPSLQELSSGPASEPGAFAAITARSVALACRIDVAHVSKMLHSLACLEISGIGNLEHRKKQVICSLEPAFLLCFAPPTCPTSVSLLVQLTLQILQK